MGHRSTATRLERNWNEKVTQQIISFYLRLRKNKMKWQDCSVSTKNKKVIPSPMFNYHSLIPWGSFRRRKVGIISGSGSFRGLYRTQIRKSVSKSDNSKLKVDFLSESFKFKLSKCKIHFHNWQFKSHNWHSTTANSQLRKRTSPFSVSTLTTPPLPRPHLP